MASIIKIDHIAIAVADLPQGQRFWHEVLGLKLAHAGRVPDEGVDVAFLPVGDSAVELLQPFEANGVAKFLEKRGPGIHHVCFEVDDIAGMMAQLTAADIPLLSPTPRVTPEGKQFVFIHPKGTGGVLVELYELPK